MYLGRGNPGYTYMRGDGKLGSSPMEMGLGALVDKKLTVKQEQCKGRNSMLAVLSSLLAQMSTVHSALNSQNLP